MRLLTFSVLTVAFILVAPFGVLAAPDDKPAASQSDDATAGPMSRRGDELIAALPEIPFGINRVTRLEANGDDDKAFATSRSTLLSSGKGDTLRYAYTNVSLMRSKDGSVIEVKTTGTLTRRFRPEKIVWEIIDQKPTGYFSKTVETMTIDDEEIVRVKTDADGKTTEKRMPTPKEEFVYLIDDLMLMLKIKPDDRFILRDLDPDTGRLNRRTYVVSKKDDNQTRVGIRKHPSKVETESYLLHGPDMIMKHTIHDLALTFTATTEARLSAVENVFRRMRRPAKP
ncbi:MAG: hypothetical protein H6819_03895 [Phycisphaerales bacterium]|nr:hypothetical protein [Phycisphaerales bacterium]MCB9856341.1 hypothetical protein [Phycisphaerales bacterium]MCB9864013.1 hypothetical protein [Phycisphaerales bacterium]